MALGIRHVAVLVGSLERVTILEPSHGRLAVGVRRITPAKHALGYQLRTLRAHVATPVFQYHVGIAGHGLHTLLVIVLQVSHRRVCLVRAESVAQVQPVTVHLVLLQPVLQGTYEHLVGRFETVVPVLIDIVRVGRRDVEPRVVLQVVAVGIQLVHGIVARSVVEHHVEYHRHAALVTLVNERLQLVGRAVGLVGGEIQTGRIAPVVVAVKLADGHQLHGVDAQRLYVVQPTQQSAVRPLRRVVVGP